MVQKVKGFYDCGGDESHILWKDSIRNNIKNLSKILNDCPTGLLLDVGCGRGETISDIIELNKKRFNIVGIDFQKDSLKYAKDNNIEGVQTDLEYTLPFKDNSFDTVFSHQVIEHINNLDNFIEELFRVTKSGGICIICTENLSSWHNIFAITLGFQEFSNSPSKNFNVANPFWRQWKIRFESRLDHKTIIAIKSLYGLLEVHGFIIDIMIGSGYYPFFGIIGEIFARLDKTHARHIICKAVKVNK